MNTQNEFTTHFTAAVVQFRNSTTEDPKVKPSVYRFWNFSKNYILNFNIFNNRTPLNVTSHQLCNEIYSTRIFILLLVTFLTVCGLFSALLSEMQTKTISKVNEEIYEKLEQKYSETLRCPCKKISIEYKEFSSMQTIIHPICSSIYITDEWFSKYLPVPEGNMPHPFPDFFNRQENFRKIGPQQFQILSLLCNLTKRTIHDNLVIFNATTLINSHVVSSSFFELQTKAFIDQFISSTINTFTRMLDTVVSTTQDAEFSPKFKPFDLWWQYDNFGSLPLPCLYECRSKKQTDCASVGLLHPPGPFVNLPTTVSALQFPYHILGWYGGCSIMSSLMISNFECFFSDECLYQIWTYIFIFDAAAHNHVFGGTYPPPYPLTYNTLNSSKLIRSTMNTSVKEIIRQLMVESWNSEISYSKYFSACEPTSCSYTHKGKRDFLSVVSLVIGLVGGLTTILKLIILPIVRFFRRKKQPPPSSSRSSQKTVRRHLCRRRRRIGFHPLRQH